MGASGGTRGSRQQTESRGCVISVVCAVLADSLLSRGPDAALSPSSRASLVPAASPGLCASPAPAHLPTPGETGPSGHRGKFFFVALEGTFHSDTVGPWEVGRFLSRHSSQGPESWGDKAVC